MKTKIKFVYCVVSSIVFSTLVLSQIAIAQTPAETAAKPSGVQTGESAATNQASGLGNQAAAADARLEQTTKLFLSAMDELVPGKIESGDKTDVALRSAAKAFSESQFDQARKIITSYQETDADFPPADLVYASLYFSTNRLNDGIRFLEIAAENSPEYPGTYLAFARMALNQKRYTDSRALLEKASRKIKTGEHSEKVLDHFKAQFYEAVTLVSLRQGRLEEATLTADAFAKLSPESPKSLTVSAEVNFRNKDFEKCIENLQRLKTIEPTTRTPELIVATWFGQIKDSKNSKKWIELAAKKYPDDMVVQTEHASFLVESEEFDLAAQLIKKIETTDKETKLTIPLKAKIAFARRDYGAAEIEYGKLFESNSASFDVANMYAMSLIESPFEEKKKIAQQLCQRNFKSVPSNQVAQAALGWVFYRKGDVENARQLYTRAAQTTQMPPEVAYFLAKFLADANDFDRSESLLNKALETEGLYLYRLAARDLLRDVREKKKTAQKASEGELPSPDKK